MNRNEVLRRREKRETRATFRQTISREHAITRGYAVMALNLLGRGFWERLKWLLLGK